MRFLAAARGGGGAEVLRASALTLRTHVRYNASGSVGWVGLLGSLTAGLVSGWSDRDPVTG